MYSLGVKLEEYWEEIRYKKKSGKPVEETMFVFFFLYIYHPQHLIARFLL